MTEQLWDDVDRYFVEKLHADDPVLDRALQRATEGGLPAIQVSVSQGKFLYQLAKIAGAKRILEIGTLGGYSTIWLGRALPNGGELITMELEPHHAEVAQANIDDAGLGARVQIVVGRAVDSLETLYGGYPDPFDFIFIDADKPSNPEYWRWALKFSHPGTVIFVDNVVRNGGVIDANSTNAQIIGVRQVTDLIAAEPRVEAMAMQSVGSKGYDGYLIARVIS
jgi:predicted O-methyltransferase YrrM